MQSPKKIAFRVGVVIQYARRTQIYILHAMLFLINFPRTALGCPLITVRYFNSIVSGINFESRDTDKQNLYNSLSLDFSLFKIFIFWKGKLHIFNKSKSYVTWRLDIICLT